MKAETEIIKILLNGKEQEIKSGMTVTDLLLKWRMRPELVTVEINEMILQKLDYDTTQIKEGDKIEFIFYMGGGAQVAGIFSGGAWRGAPSARSPQNIYDEHRWGCRATGPEKIPATCAIHRGHI